MNFIEQWKRGIILIQYALEAQLCGAKTMAFYEDWVRELREDKQNLQHKVWDLEDSNWELQRQNWKLQDQLNEANQNAEVETT